jgi:alpha-glucosidase (family GH31 glycosyl hydrolase)
VPTGRWYELWSGAAIEGGGSRRLAAPAGQAPILVRGGALLALAPTRTHIPDDHVFDALELHAYPPCPAQFTLYEDDGLTRAYQRGEYAKTTFAVTEEAGGYRIDVASQPGAWRPALDRRAVTVVLHESTAPTAVSGLDGLSWSHDDGLRQTTIRFSLRPGEPAQVSVTTMAIAP